MDSDWETVQFSYLHTLGNLTLTGYNSELSDRPFSEKLLLEGGFKDSPLWLNRSVSKYKTLSKETIEEKKQLPWRSEQSVSGSPLLLQKMF
ncbi:HNH endonuclease family protein [Cytobacillus firmus]|uniref:GmrSD restriction endonuclease domain-containing protein n=1 Tax=Cytobacillus TaxID=2675230 RepID=UPI000DEACA09